MVKFNSRLAVAGLFVALSAASFNSPAAEPSTGHDIRDLNSYLCKDVMRMSGEDRNIALALAQGYVLGKKGQTQFDVSVLSQITDKFITYCLDHPNAKALQSLERIAK